MYFILFGKNINNWHTDCDYIVSHELLLHMYACRVRVTEHATDMQEKYRG